MATSFSYDLYPDLDRQLNAALARNLAGSTSPEAVATGGIAAAVGAALHPHQPNVAPISAEVTNRALAELTGAASEWDKYGAELGMPQADVHEIVERNKDTITRLYAAKDALRASGEVTPTGENIGDTMHLVLIPWGAFLKHYEDLPKWLAPLRQRQGVELDYVNDNLMAEIRRGHPYITDLLRTGSFQQTRTDIYIADQITRQGNWGVMLMQASAQAGIESLKGKSPDELTDNGTKPLEVAGQEVGAMGILEWLSLTLQEDPRNLSKDDYSWLLANRFEANGDPQVPCGGWGAGRVGSGLAWAGHQGPGARPRLAVM